MSKAVDAMPAENTYGISVVEYVNQFFMDKAKDEKYLAELLKRCHDNGVKNHLIMCDGEGRLGDPDATKRGEAVQNHRKWLDAAKTLGCVSIRVNAASDGITRWISLSFCFHFSGSGADCV